MDKYFENARNAIREYSPVEWDRIPDFGLYMDQLITFITQVFTPLYGGAEAGYLSASMINNYVKAKLLPRPTGKKYSREQIALLMMIVALKQVSSMDEIRRMFDEAQTQGIGIETLYTRFFEKQTQALHTLFEEETARDGLPVSLELAIGASAYHSGCAFALREK